jgi:hypothetical protein
MLFYACLFHPHTDTGLWMRLTDRFAEAEFGRSRRLARYLARPRFESFRYRPMALELQEQLETWADDRPALPRL